MWDNCSIQIVHIILHCSIYSNSFYQHSACHQYGRIATTHETRSLGLHVRVDLGHCILGSLSDKCLNSPDCRTRSTAIDWDDDRCMNSICTHSGLPDIGTTSTPFIASACDSPSNMAVTGWHSFSKVHCLLFFELSTLKWANGHLAVLDVGCAYISVNITNSSTVPGYYDRASSVSCKMKLKYLIYLEHCYSPASQNPSWSNLFLRWHQPNSILLCDMSSNVPYHSLSHHQRHSTYTLHHTVFIQYRSHQSLSCRHCWNSFWHSNDY